MNKQCTLADWLFWHYTQPWLFWQNGDILTSTCTWYRQRQHNKCASSTSLVVMIHELWSWLCQGIQAHSVIDKKMLFMDGQYLEILTGRPCPPAYLSQSPGSTCSGSYWRGKVPYCPAQHEHCSLHRESVVNMCCLLWHSAAQQDYGLCIEWRGI